jgi:hypothetical protein
MHLAQALAVPGVLDILTHDNRPKTRSLGIFYKDMTSPGGSPFKPLHDARIRYSGQPVALVVAQTFEAARYAASLVRVEYDVAAARNQSHGAPGPRAQAEPAESRLLATARRKGRRRSGLRARTGDARCRVLQRRGAPQPAGAVRLDRAARRRRPLPGVRQDAELAEQPLVRVARVRPAQGQGDRAQPLRGRRLRLRPAPAVPADPGDDGVDAAGALRARGA